MTRLDQRQAVARRRRWAAGLKSPLFLRFTLFDPQPLLDRAMPYVAWLFGPVGLLLWCAVVGVGALLGLMHWTELTADFTDRMLSAENLAVAWLVYPVVKVIHESFHGFALRRCGAEVHQTGVMLVALMPLPFVDATSSTVLERKGDRILVGAAGILVELFLGGLALIGWAASEPSLFRVVCYNIIMISGFSTLLFNGNPLQRYDGYYILTDLVEIPGLASRSAQYVAYLMKRYLLGDPVIQPPRATAGEKAWFAFYGPASFIYRTGLVIVIALYVAEKYPAIGMLVAVWALVGYLWTPLAGLLRSNAFKHAEWRGRALVGGGGALAVIALLLLIPIPFGVTTQGMLDMPDNAAVRAGTRGEIIDVLVAQGETVQAGQPLLRLAEPAASAKVERLAARLREDEARFTQNLAADRVKAMNSDRVDQARQELAEAQKELDALTVTSPVAGVVSFYDPAALTGRYLAKGEIVAQIWDPARAVIRSFVPMGQIALVRSDTRGVAIRPSFDPATSLPARITAAVPSATDRLPNAVLSLEGGGPFAVKRGADNTPRTEEAMYQVDVQLWRRCRSISSSAASSFASISVRHTLLVIRSGARCGSFS